MDAHNRSAWSKIQLLFGKHKAHSKKSSNPPAIQQTLQCGTILDGPIFPARLSILRRQDHEAKAALWSDMAECRDFFPKPKEPSTRTHTFKQHTDLDKNDPIASHDGKATPMVR
eukprot:c19995_g2_i1.p1 GENE.c19995_g2_i1~~c19995_g2_i1.p1  ORF type:complete len:128 (-),score=27.08 c19995_g2_i1:277-618(-)